MLWRLESLNILTRFYFVCDRRKVVILQFLFNNIGGCRSFWLRIVQNQTSWLDIRIRKSQRFPISDHCLVISCLQTVDLFETLNHIKVSWCMSVLNLLTTLYDLLYLKDIAYREPWEIAFYSIYHRKLSL